MAGFRNFLPGGLETSILHFAIRRYLCQPGQRYHITDLSKGGMRVKDAPADRFSRWNEWYPLLLEELRLVARPGARVFAVGRAVDDYLSGRDDFPWPFTRVLHYSSMAGAARAEAIKGHAAAFEQFRGTVSLDDLLAAAVEVLHETGMPANVRKESLERLTKNGPLTDSQQQLIFSYKLAFERGP